MAKLAKGWGFGVIGMRINSWRIIAAQISGQVFQREHPP